MALPIAIAVVEQDDKFLIGIRPEGTSLAGYWEFPGGKIDPGETPAEAARRECLEETGLAVEIIGELDRVEHRYDHAKLELHFLAARLLDVNALPRAPFRWVPRNTLNQYRFPPANAALLEYLLRDT